MQRIWQQATKEEKLLQVVSVLIFWGGLILFQRASHLPTIFQSDFLAGVFNVLLSAAFFLAPIAFFVLGLWWPSRKV